MRCKYPGAFWPVAQRQRYIEHCRNCRNLYRNQCLLEADLHDESVKCLLALANTDDIREAIETVLEGVLRQVERKHWLREWRCRSMERRWATTRRLLKMIFEENDEPQSSEH